uniref:FH2 domain-containing protein n=1 Tax=Hucho hucho TaxID=62062 RepID=A0A4W5KVF9_9TELE
MTPSEEEKQKIQEAQLANPDVPLGSAEQFLLTLSSISGLCARLQLWAFKLNYETLEKEIAEPLFDLKLGMEQLAKNKTFKRILATLLAIGNFLNSTSVSVFFLSASVFFLSASQVAPCSLYSAVLLTRAHRAL